MIEGRGRKKGRENVGDERIATSGDEKWGVRKKRQGYARIEMGNRMGNREIRSKWASKRGEGGRSVVERLCVEDEMAQSGWKKGGGNKRERLSDSNSSCL